MPEERIILEIAQYVIEQLKKMPNIAAMDVGIKDEMNHYEVDWSYKKQAQIDRASEHAPGYRVNCFWNEDYLSLTISPPMVPPEELEDEKDSEDGGDWIAGEPEDEKGN